MKQITGRVWMIRPAHFGYNEQTASSNAFQQIEQRPAALLQASALQEFDEAASLLRSTGIQVEVIPDTPHPIKPDAIFPNNWISTHEDGTLVLYPMQAPNRRTERRTDIVERLQQQYRVSRVLDLSGHEAAGRYLEGTGSLVFDHVHKTAYACVSERTHPRVLDELCRELGYRPLLFHACDAQGKDIYHTNVMMSIGSHCVLVCSASMPHHREQKQVMSALRRTGRDIIDIGPEQMESFACNALELEGPEARAVLALSETAFRSLLPRQLRVLSRHTTLLPLRVPSIEHAGGGSVRCMLAQNFLPEEPL